MINRRRHIIVAIIKNHKTKTLIITYQFSYIQASQRYSKIFSNNFSILNQFGLCIQIIEQRMSTFKSKAALLKQHLNYQTDECPHQMVIVRDCKNTSSKQELSLQQPIIIEKKSIVKNQSNVKKVKTVEIDQRTRRKVEPWVPINIPARQNKLDLENVSMNTAPTNGGNKEIQIQIQKDDKGKDCLKKLFKKIHKLEEDLKESQKERVRLNLQLENYRNRSKICGEHDKLISKLQSQKYRLEVDLDMVRRLLKEREDEIQRVNLRAPKEIIKEVIVEKPVEVIVEVPKLVPGPERIVQKIVEVPKYIEVQKKVPVQVIKQVIKEVVRTVEVPTIIQKPVYIDKPIYIDRPIEIQKRVEVPVQVRVQVPVEYPVYIEKPIVEEEWLIKIRQMEAALESTLRENSLIISQNGELRIRVNQLSQNLQMMRRHNQQKNRQVEMLLQNSIDYLPFSPNYQDQSMASVKYSISSNPHPRII